MVRVDVPVKVPLLDRVPVTVCVFVPDDVELGVLVIGGVAVGDCVCEPEAETKVAAEVGVVEGVLEVDGGC